MILYYFYYTENEIVDHNDDGAVYAEVEKYLGTFRDFNYGNDYFKYKYPTKNIGYRTIKVLDIFNE